MIKIILSQPVKNDGLEREIKIYKRRAWTDDPSTPFSGLIAKVLRILFPNGDGVKFVTL